MKILLISRGYPSKRRPQWGIFERDQALGLQALGHKVIVISVELRYHLRSIGFFHFRENGLDVYSIGFPNFFTQMTQKWAFVVRRKLAFVLYKKIEKKYGKPDILYAQYFYNITIAAELKKEFDIPLVGIEHWSKIAQENLPQYILSAGKVAYGIADEIISVSESLQKNILRYFNKESIVINNMVGNEFTMNKYSNKFKKKDFPNKFISIGSLITRKGYDILIDAYVESGLKEKGVLITIVGSGPEYDTLQDKIINEDLLNNIILVGGKNREEIIELLKLSDVFILSSRSETFGVVCIEALCLGLPIVATACGGPEEFINERRGLLVRPDDSNALSVALQTMYYTYPNYNRQIIAEESRQEFSSTAIAKKIITLFENVITSTSLP